MKSLDLFFGIKAEQSLRDLVRNASESSGGGTAAIELYPLGKKDWIAGGRLSEETTFLELRNRQSEIMRQLIALGSHQRIRQDGLRIYAVHPPVPVFRDPADEQDADRSSASLKKVENDSMICPNCGVEVHRFNLLFGPKEKIVGCYLCRGDQR